MYEDAFERMAQKGKRKKQSKKQITIEQQHNSSSRDIPNVFGQQSGIRQVQSPNHHNQANTMQKLELVDDYYLGQQEQQKNITDSLSVFQTIKYYLGLHTISMNSSQKKTVYIDCNNPSQPQLRSNSQNDISISSFGAFIFLVFIFFMKPQYLVWLIACIIGFVMQSIFKTLLISMYPSIIITLLIISILIDLIFQYLLIRRRRVWDKQSYEKMFQVYHHNGDTAQWVGTSAYNLRSGFIIKVNSQDEYPADCIILHDKQSLVPIATSKISAQLKYQPQTIFKQSIIRSDIMILPINGYLELNESTNEFTQNSGQLHLSFPIQITHNVTSNNIALRGEKNLSQNQVLCMVINSGIQCFNLKYIQYQRIYVKEKGKNVSLQSIINRLIYISILVYIVLLCLTVLIGYLYNELFPLPYFMSQLSTSVWKIPIHCLINYVIFVPIFLKTSYLLFSFFQGVITEKSIRSKIQRIINSQIKVQDPDIEIRDYSCLERMKNVNTLITSIDCLRNSQAFSMSSFKVKDVHHVFSNKKNEQLDEQMYSVEQIELIKYFMSVALLTTHSGVNQKISDMKQHAYQKAIVIASKFCDVRMDFNPKDQTIIVNRDQFKLKLLLKIPETYSKPFSMFFFKAVRKTEIIEVEEQQMVVQPQQKILCVIRGDPILLLDKVYGKEVEMSKWAKAMQQEKGHHVQIVGKIAFKYTQFQEIKKAFLGNSVQVAGFTKGLDKYISKMQAMGFLVFNNQFLTNPLSKSLIGLGDHNSSYSSKINEKKNMIILAPSSQSNSSPQFQSIHTLTNLLQQGFGYPLSRIPSKLIHDQIITSDAFIEKLQEEQIVVLNGWNKKNLIDMLQEVTIGKVSKQSQNQQQPEENIRLMSYFQKDEYLFLQRLCEVNISKNGFDLPKYSDIILKNPQLQSSALLQSSLYDFQGPLIKRLLFYDTPIIKSNQERIILNQFTKQIMIITIQFIGIFFTWGTGMLTFPSPFFILMELICLTDFLYYLNFQQQQIPFKTQWNLAYVCAFQSLIAILQSIFITLICAFSLSSATNSDGTFMGKQFASSIISFVVINFLIMRKLFQSPVISIYRFLIIILQIAAYYIGIIIITAVDGNNFTTFQLKGIGWYLFRGKLMLCGVLCVAVCLCVEGLKVIFRAIFQKNYSNHYKKLAGNEPKKTQKKQIELREIKKAKN